MVQLEQPRIFQQQQHQYLLQQQQRIQQQFMNGGRGTPMGHGGGVDGSVQVIKPKKKKKKRLQQLNRTNIDDSLFDQDEAQWLSQFGNGHMQSEPESMQTQFIRRGNPAPTSSRKYNSIEAPGIDNRGLHQRRGPEIMSSQPETESESMAQYQQKRVKINNIMLGASMGRNLNNNTVLGLQQKRNNLFNSSMMEEGKYLPPLNNVAQSLNNSMVSRNQLGARTQLDNYNYLKNPQSEAKQHRKIFALSGQGVESSVNYHSQSSTKLSELHGPGHKRTLQPLKNTLAQRLDNSYGLSDINERVEGGIGNQESRNIRGSMLSKYGTDSEALSKPQVINLGGGLALKRNNPQMISQSILRQGQNLQSFGRSNQQTDSLITFRDDDNPQHRLVGQQVSRTNQSTDNIRKPMKRQIHQDPLPQIQLINMEIDTDVLEKLQSGQLSDEQKHEIIYNILRGHLQKNGGTMSSNSPSNERDGLQVKSPMGHMVGMKSTNLLRKKRDLDENFSQSLPMTHVQNKQRVSRMNEDSDMLEDEVRAFKKKSKSPGSSNERKIDSVINNLTTSRHVNRYCRHCYIKALQEEQRTKKNHQLIYDANNCQRFIEKIKNINIKMHRKHRRGVIESSNHGYRGGYISPSQDESQQNSARLIHLNKLRAQIVRNSSNLRGVNHSSESMVNLKGHKRSGSIETRKFVRARNSQSFGGGNEVMDSQITLGERRKKHQLNGEGQHMKTTSLNAGGYTIDVIRRSNNELVESAKFNSNHDSPRLPPQHMIPGEGNSSVKRDSESKKLISISLAPQLIDAFASRKATYVIRKNQKQESPPLFDPNQRRKTTYYERCKMRKMQLYGNKSQVNLHPPTPPIEFEGPFLNVEVRVQSAPRSVRSAGLSALEVSHRDHSIQMQISMREHALQIEVEKRSNQMQTTQKNFHEIAIETEQVEEELLEVEIDQATQTDEIGLWLLKRGQKQRYMTYKDYQTQQIQNEESMSARTHNKSVQAKSKKRKLPVKPPPAKDLRDPSPKNLQNPRLFDLLHNNRNESIQCSIDEDELTELQGKLRMEELEAQARLRQQREHERELMLRNAKPLMSGDPFYAQIRLKAESSETFPKENYDWRQSGLYEQIYKKYQDDKDRVIREAERRLKESSMPEEERKKRDLMRDPGYRKAFGVLMIAGGGDNHDIVSIENSQDASSNFNMKKDIQEQELDSMYLNPNNEEIYTEMEVTYMAGLLKRKAQHTLDQVKDIHLKAISTLAVLTLNMIQGDTPLEQILTYYQEPTPENVTRLLVRCKKLYDARGDSKKIIHSIILLQELISQLKIKRDPALEEQTLILTRRLQSQLSNFKNENKIFKGRFMFDSVDYYQWLPDLENQLTTGDFYIREKLKAMQEEQERLLQQEKARLEKERQDLLLRLQEEEEERRRMESERRLAEEEKRVREEAERRARAVEVAMQTSDKAESVKGSLVVSQQQALVSPKVEDKLGINSVIEEERKSVAVEKPQSPPTPVIDRIAMLRAQNVQTAAEISSRKEVINHLTIPTMSTPERQFNQSQSKSYKKIIQETAGEDYYMKTQMSNGTYAGPKLSSGGPSDYRGMANSALKIMEQKRPYYYEEPGENSSRQLTNIVSNYHDDRIYEVQQISKPRNLTIHSPKMLSQSNTPKVKIEGRNPFQNAPENQDFSKSRYSVKTVPGGKSTHQAMDEVYQDYNTQKQAQQLMNTMSASINQSEDGVRLASQKNTEGPQKNLRYSQINSSLNGKIITIQDQHQKQ